MRAAIDIWEPATYDSDRSDATKLRRTKNKDEKILCTFCGSVHARDDRRRGRSRPGAGRTERKAADVQLRRRLGHSTRAVGGDGKSRRLRSEHSAKGLGRRDDYRLRQ